MKLYQFKKDLLNLLDDYRLGAESFPKATSLALIGTGLLLVHLYMLGLYFCLPGVFLLLGAALEDNAHREIRRKLLLWTGAIFLLAQFPATTSFLTIYHLDISLFNKAKILLNETILGKTIFSFCFYFIILISFTIIEWIGEKAGRVVSIGGGDILFFTVMTTVLPFFTFLTGVVSGSVITLLFSFFWKRPPDLEETSYKDYPPAIPGLLFGMGIAPLIQQYFM